MFHFFYSYEKMNSNTNLILRNYRILSKSSFDSCDYLRHLFVLPKTKNYDDNFKNQQSTRLNFDT